MYPEPWAFLPLTEVSDTRVTYWAAKNKKDPQKSPLTYDCK